MYDFFKLTLVNVLVKNGDAHLKNSGVIYHHLHQFQIGQTPEAERQLAPIFDVVSTVPYLPNDSMALSLTGSKRWPKWKVLQQFARQHCGLNNKQINLVVDEVQQASTLTLPLLNDLANQHSDFLPIAEIMDTLLRQPYLK